MARLLPAHQLLSTKRLVYELNVLAVHQDALPQFQLQGQDMPPVPTPYGPLAWKVWFAPNICRFLPSRKTQPIPMSMTNHHHIAIPTNNTTGAMMMQVQSAPTYAHEHQLSTRRSSARSIKTSLLSFTTAARPPPPRRSYSNIDEPLSTPATSNNDAHHHHHPVRPVVVRSSSLENSTQRPSALSLALLAEEESLEKRRAALHHPPPVESSYGYAYNNHAPPTVAAPMEITTPIRLGSSPSNIMPPLSSTPPPLFLGNNNTPGGFGGSMAQYNNNNGPLLPPRHASTTMAVGMTPPFATLPTALSEPDIATATTTTANAATAATSSHATLESVPTSLDMLHSSPFNKTGASFSESEVMKHSVVIPPCTLEDDMPFAVDDDDTDFNLLLQDSAVTLLAHKCATASRLQLLDQDDNDMFASSHNNTNPQQQVNNIRVASLSDQLAEFKSFGASLHMESNNMFVTNLQCSE